MTSHRPPPVITSSEQSRLAVVDGSVALGAAGVPTLLGLLTDPSWVVRRGVVAGLAALGDAAVPGLVEVLQHRRDDEARIAAAVDALSASNGAASEAAFELASSADPAVVYDAAQIMGRRRDSTAVPLLEKLALGSDDNVAVAAIEALGRIGGSAALESLAAAARSGHFFRVFPTIDALGRTGDPRAVAPLSALLDQPLYALEAARALARTGESSAVAPLSRLLSLQGTTSVRTFVVAFAELHERATKRHGTPRAVEEAAVSLAGNRGLVRRLGDALLDAEPEEQVALCVVLGALGNEDSVALLTTLVESAAPVGPAASKALERIGHGSETELVRLLQEEISARRLAILPLLTRQSSSDAVSTCLADPDPAVRALACEVLARLGDTRRVESLFERLVDPDASVVQAATSALQSLGGPATEKRALSLAETGTPVVRRAALRILAYFGYPSAFDVFLRGVRDADARIREVSIQGLAFVEDDRASETLLGLAEDTTQPNRASVIKALGHHANDPRTRTLLLRTLRDPEPWVRYYACQSLGKSRGAEVSAEVAALLDDEAGQVRIAAIEALSALGGELAHARLVRASASDDPDVRRAALIGLGITKDESALPTLLAAARTEDATTRLIAMAALSNFESAEVLPVLLAAIHDPAETVRTSAIGFVTARPGEDTANALIELLRRHQPGDWVVAALASGVAGRIPAMAAALTTADDPLAEQLVSALARMGTPEARATLVQLMSLPAIPARKVAATRLGALGTEDALLALRRAATNDPDPDVRRIATLILAS